MQSLRVFVSSCELLCLLLAACGSDHRHERVSDAGLDAAADTGGDADADADADADGDADAPPDAGVPACTVATPAAVDCGGKSCAPGQTFCCRTGSDADGELLGSCFGLGASCGGWHLDCDDDADCGAGTICCNAYDAEVNGFRSRCAAPGAASAVCGDPLATFHVCTCTAQCAAGETCQPLYTEVGTFQACGPAE